MGKSFIRLGFLACLLGLFGCGRIPVDPCSTVQPPVAMFRVFPESGELPTLVTLDASDSLASAGALVEYLWDFGDGTRASGPVVRHKFADDPTGPEEQAFQVTLTVVQECAMDGVTCRQTDQTARVLRYGRSYPLNVVCWEINPIYYGSLIEGFVRNESEDLRVTHGRVMALFYRGPDHVLVGLGERDLWDIRPGEERFFMVPASLRPGEFDWVELRTQAFTAKP